MSYQGFSPKLGLAMKVAKAKSSKPSAAPLSDAEKAKQKQLAKARNEKRLNENLAQRALVNSHPER